MELSLKKKTDHDIIVKTVRKNIDFIKELNQVNVKFDKVLFKDELDWLRFLLDSPFTVIWQDGNTKGIIGILHSFNEDSLLDDEAAPIKKCYWYTLPNNDKLELVYKAFLENYFKCQVEGVQIDGSLNKQPTKRKAVCNSPSTNNKPPSPHSNGKSNASADSIDVIVANQPG